VDLERLNGYELSSEYLHYVRSHPIVWEVPTQILYGSNDNLTSFKTMNEFAEKHHAGLTVMENGEHWFHTDEQMRFLDDWIKKCERKQEYSIREIQTQEIPLLEDFLYEAIFLPEGVNPPPRSIIRNEDLQVYVRDFGLFTHDRCLVAEIEGKIVGAVWSRIMRDYGHIDDDTPSLAMSLYKEYRNQGMGTELLHQMFQLLRREGYEKVSLSVQKENYAAKMYLKAGFEVVKETPEEYIMVCNLIDKRNENE